MPEEVLFKTEEEMPITEIAEALRDAADQIETGEQRYELEYEIRWTK